MTLPNGDIYVGAFEGSLPHRMGRYTWSDGTVYEGEWDKGKMTGRGQISWLTGATYEGDFAGGYRHGCGTFSGADGAVYDGAWRMNVQHGLGRKIFPNSDTYEGHWKEGVIEGTGTYKWSCGNTYIGNWKGGKMCGRGLMKWANGDLYDGLWLDGLKHGSGSYKFADGAYYVGTWSKGLKDGLGTFFPAGSKLSYLSQYFVCDKNCDCKPSLEKCEDKKPSFRRTLSEKLLINALFRNSGRISSRSASLDGWSHSNSIKNVLLPDFPSSLSCASGKDQEEVEGGALVYVREYMQGILVAETIQTNVAELLNRNRRQRKWQKKEVKRSGETIHKGHSSYYLMLNLQLGIRYTVGKITPVPMREVRFCDFGPQARISMYFPRKGSQFTPAHNSIGFHWKDYCPMVFRNLREMFKIDAADYMMSICGVDGLRELSSPGKSGSIFYLSQDERFIIKTLRKYELKVLLKMLPGYYNHVQTYDNTLITKFFGLHQITLRGSRKVRFVVMGNMFCTELRIHRRYDLKGSSQGRSTNKCKIDETTTLKDLDLSYAFRLEKSWRESLFKQISLDCMFLESQCIIDYSLLLGLHFRAPDHLKAVVEPQDILRATDFIADDDGFLLLDPLCQSKGLLLVTHKPDSVSSLPGSHIRGGTLRAPSTGDKEVDLLLPGTGRLRVQLGINMPAQAIKRLQHDGSNSGAEDRFEVYDVVLYLGIIDILQEYNITKKIEHACKSLQFDPMTISAVEPKFYAKRFIDFLEKVFPEEI
ncbi:phosphatidylinositol 4-phosphate 5-kinase 8-like isoform X2 [Aristolochia californica]